MEVPVKREESTGLLDSNNKREQEEEDEEEEELELELDSYVSSPSSRPQLFKIINPFYVGVSVTLLLILLSIYGNTHSSRINNSVEYCKWEFDSYSPSSYEQLWATNAKEWQKDVCTKVEEPSHQSNSKTIIMRTLQLYQIPASITWATKDSTAKFDYEPKDDLFSRMNYKRLCFENGGWVQASGKGVQLIEPLWGMLRDPYDLFCGSQRLHLMGWPDAGGQSKAHILPQGYAPYTYTTTGEDLNSIKWHTHGSPPWINSYAPSPSEEFGTLWTAPKNVLLDLGSSYFGSWRGATNAASGAWMYRTYHERGLPFHKYVAVEVESLSPTEAYNQLPADLVGVYSFMNVPLNVDTGDKLNVVTLLESIAKSNDHVVLKLDIDSANMELPFAHALRDDKVLGALVSELFFEHHVDIPAMRSSWGYDLKEDLNDSYVLFKALRSNGIRAHSWP